MSIFPLPQFEADVEADRKAYEALQAPKSIVVRFGYMRMVGEYPYDGQAKPGCGSKIVCRTHRGTEICEMLTTTCPNSGCNKSVSRQEMLGYIENSGGRDFPFYTDGRVLRVATVEDLNQQAALDAKRLEQLKVARELALQVGLTQIKMVDVEPLLGQERLTFHFMCEDRVDFRPLVMELARVYHTRIELHQVGARDEARINADYERCGQHCCCRQFLKVLKPVNMKAAKTQKATLDPLKISGRCGRLMCCLRYEENTYDELKKNLPKRKTAVTTPDGPGLVWDTQILTQLVLVKLEKNGEEAAYPVESLTPYSGPPLTVGQPVQQPPKGASGPGKPGGPGGPGQGKPSGPAGGGPGGPGQPRNEARPPREEGSRGPQGNPQGGPSAGPRPERRPLTEEEKAKKRLQKLIPKSEFRSDDLHNPIDRSKPPTGEGGSEPGGPVGPGPAAGPGPGPGPG